MRCMGVMSAMTGAAALVIANAIAFAHDDRSILIGPASGGDPRALASNGIPAKSLVVMSRRRLRPSTRRSSKQDWLTRPPAAKATIRPIPASRPACLAR